MINLIRPALTLFAVLALITGLGYPLVVTGMAQLFFPYEANGSLIRQNDRVVGSELIGQSFSSPRYFLGRPSATSPFPNNGMASGGSNNGPLNPVLAENVSARIAALRNVDPTVGTDIPADLVTASGSGLDPHLSPAAVYYQAQRVARERGVAPEVVMELIAQRIEAPDFDLFGKARINVLKLNLALDRLVPTSIAQ